MANKRYSHPYLTKDFLTRNPFNYCLNCGGILGNIRPDLKNARQVWLVPWGSNKVVLNGYTHIICPHQRDQQNDSINVR